MENYDTLVEAMNALREQGYTRDFNLLRTCLECTDLSKTYAATNFKVDKSFRFEGMTNPSDSSILLAISTDDNEKGVLVDAYGAYATILDDEMLKKLQHIK